MSFVSRYFSITPRTFGWDALAMEALEDRCLLSANIRLDPATGVVSIIGSPLSDQVSVDIVASTTVRVTLNTTEIEQFPLAQVTRVDFLGRAGDDLFFNRTSIPSHAFGEEGNDKLTGGYSINVLSGGAGNDSLVGRNAADLVYGGVGDDQIFGGPGVDRLYGDDGDDVINGQEGGDFLYGLSGNDTLHGEAGNDVIYGGNNNDVLFGGVGDDKVYGDYGDDQLFGGDGDDVLEGFLGADILRGEDGNDILRGQDDPDIISGDKGDDQLFGGDGDDELFGWAGNDAIYGGAGADFIRGGAGNDSLSGDDGNDRLYGESDIDRLFGGNGDDRIFGGGVSVPDTLYGNAGRDRFLFEGSDVIADLNGDDAKLIFSPGNSNWTAAEVEIFDQGFQVLYELTRNNLLLRDTLDPTGIKFVKYTSIAGGSLSINSLNTRTTSAGSTYSRTIQVADWNEYDPRFNQMLINTVVHEVGHNWDSILESGTAAPGTQGLWTQFLSRSGWTQTQPANLALYNRSADGKWWYLKTAEFARDYGRFNPYEDWSSVWERNSFPSIQPAGANLNAKLTTIRALFLNLASRS